MNNQKVEVIDFAYLQALLALARLEEREVEKYADQGRAIDALTIQMGSPGLPLERQTTQGYAYLALVKLFEQENESAG